MSRELDFIDFINENADNEEIEKHYQHRNPNAWTIRSALANLSVEEVEDPSEREILLEYQDILRQLKQKQQKLYDTHELWDNICAGNDKNYLTMKNQLQDEAFDIASQRDDLDRQLKELEQNPILEKVIEREKALHRKKLGQEAVQRRREAEARAKERAEQTERELRERYQESRQKRLQEKEQEQQRQKQEEISESTKKEEILDCPKKNKLMNMLTSKRIAAVISTVLCVVLYLSFLAAFSTKVNTYICYTQEKDSSFHSLNCYRIRGSSVTETTIYEASKTHTRCQTCNPTDKTTITDRNYVIPAIISVPISTAVFFLITYKKEK